MLLQPWSWPCTPHTHSACPSPAPARPRLAAWLKKKPPSAVPTPLPISFKATPTHSRSPTHLGGSLRGCASAEPAPHHLPSTACPCFWQIPLGEPSLGRRAPPDPAPLPHGASQLGNSCPHVLQGVRMPQGSPEQGQQPRFRAGDTRCRPSAHMATEPSSLCTAGGDDAAIRSSRTPRKVPTGSTHLPRRRALSGLVCAAETLSGHHHWPSLSLSQTMT